MNTLYAHKFTSGVVAVYWDAACSGRAATFPADYTNKPTRRNKYVTINCERYRLEWV